MQVTLRGIPASPGIAIGPAVTYRVEALEPPKYAIDDPAAELARYDEAAARVRAELERMRDRTLDELGPHHAAIFDAHLAILDDVALRPELQRRLREERLNVDFLLHDIVSSYAALIKSIDDPQFRERASDFVDVGQRVMSHLLQTELENLQHLDHASVIVAHELTPSETINMDMTNVLGLVTDAGGPTSHMAILARAFEVPAVVGLRFAGLHVSPNDTVIVDGTRGKVYVRPKKVTLERYERWKKRREKARRALLERGFEGPVKTQDGHRVVTLANIELPLETEACKRAHCEGIGLYRTEYLFLNRTTPPAEEEQYEAYRGVLERMSGMPVTIRTLDLGGDKVTSAWDERKESNPQLGWRAIRFCLDRPDIFKAQLRALLRAGEYGDLRVMFPMISGVDVLREAITVVDQVKADLAGRRVPHNANIPLGCMIEVPGAVEMAPELAALCQFFSIGTNDLIQYCLAVDRTNERTAHLYDSGHPAVLRMLKRTLEAARKAGIGCSICGEMAGDPALIELLVGMGFEELSMSSVSLPGVRAEIAALKLPVAKRFASKALRAQSASDVTALLAERSERRGSGKTASSGAT